MKTGIIASCFDLLHAGHMDMLEECAMNCDKLIIALHVDPHVERPEKNKPIETLVERFYKLSNVSLPRGMASNCMIVPYETEADLLLILKLYKPTFRFLGSDYKNKPYTGKELNTTVHWIDRSHGISSSGLRDKIVDHYQNVLKNDKGFKYMGVGAGESPELKFRFYPKKKATTGYFTTKKPKKRKK